MFISEKLGFGKKILLNKKGLLPTVPFFEFKIYNNFTEVNFEKYKGSNLLIVNLASRCGYTPQYEELEKLHMDYKNYVKVIGFPSNNFGGQEPGNDVQIASYCKLNYGVTFDLFPKADVTGSNIQPVYQWLTNPDKNGWNNELPQWNFYKYLIDKNGILKGVFSSAVSPLSIEIINAIMYE